MKKVIEDLAPSFNCTTHYSGGRRIMYVKGERNLDFARYIRQVYPNLAFVVKPVDELPTIEVFTSAEVEDNLAANIINKLAQNQPSITVVQELKNEPQAEVTTLPVIRLEDYSKLEKEQLRAEVDAYLLANPIDKSQKGFFVPVAEKFACTSDYIRKRYNALKEKGLIEKQIVNA